MKDETQTLPRVGKPPKGPPPNVNAARWYHGADPNDPPETWLDRMARAALEGMYASGDFELLPIVPDRLAARAGLAYDQAAAMLAEKRRREKKEVEG